MQKLKAGHLMLIAAGITWLLSLGMPWAQVEGVGPGYSAFQMQMYGAIALVAAIGISLVVFGAMGMWWASFIGVASAVVGAFTILAVHENVYSALRVIAPSVALGETPHVDGFGLAVIFAAGMLAGMGGFITGIQTAPKIVTRED